MATVAIYEEAAAQWQLSRGEANDDLGRRFRSQAGDGLVVDLGCGPGRYLHQIGGPVVGLDVSGAMLALARRRCHSLARADLESLPISPPSAMHLRKRSGRAAVESSAPSWISSSR